MAKLFYKGDLVTLKDTYAYNRSHGVVFRVTGYGYYGKDSTPIRWDFMCVTPLDSPLAEPSRFFHYQMKAVKPRYVLQIGSPTHDVDEAIQLAEQVAPSSKKPLRIEKCD